MSHPKISSQGQLQDYYFEVLTEEEISKIESIVDSIIIDPKYQQEMEMDLCAVHAVHGLSLDSMAEASKAGSAPSMAYSLMHDLEGIRKYLDRDTGQFKDHFLPRFSKPRKEST